MTTYQKMMRKNIITATIIQIAKLGITFFNRTIFIIYLGIFYQGVNSVFSNLISFFELFDLGIGLSLTYFLYKPLAEKNYGKIKGILLLYRKIYRLIVIVSLCVGLALIPFLNIFLKNVEMNSELYIVFGLYLLKMLCSYLFAGDINLMYARQRKYIVDIIDFLMMVLMSVLQIVVLVTTKSFILYMVLWVLYIFARNSTVAYISRKEKKYYEAIAINLTKDELQQLKNKVVGTSISKFATLIVYNTDNILLGIFLGVTYVGIYSNYTLVLMGVSYVAYSIINAMTASIAHYLEVNSKVAQYTLFKKHSFLIYSAIYFGTLGLLLTINPFIKVWVGYHFNSDVVAIIVLNFSLNLYRKICETYKNAYGILEYDKVKDILEVLLNVGFSLLFLVVFKWELKGILLGTIIANLLTSTWYNPYILYKYGFKESYKKYVLIFLKQWLVYMLAFVLCYIFMKEDYSSLGAYIINLGMLLMVIIIIYALSYYKDLKRLKNKETL